MTNAQLTALIATLLLMKEGANVEAAAIAAAITTAQQILSQAGA